MLFRSQSLGAASRVLPYLTLLFIPIIIGMPHLYEWTNPEVVNADEVLRGKAAYLNTNFFIVRAVFYFASWIGLATLLSKWSLQQDGGDQTAARKMQLLSGGGLVLYGLTITFAAVDWVMSLDPHWFSTMMGFLFMAGQGLISLAFVVIVAAALAKRAPMDHVFKAVHFHDLGKLMYAFVLLWAYFSVSQLIIIWSGNLPEEIPFYTRRFEGPWGWVSVLVLIGHFVIPFAFLLSRTIKRNPSLAAKVALWILVMRAVEIA